MPESQFSVDGVAAISSRIAEMGAKTVIDIGAGTGRWGRALYSIVPTIDAVEAHQPNIVKNALDAVYRRVMNKDVKDIESFAGYDVAVMGDVLEHLEMYDACELVVRLKRDVPAIFLTIPITVCPQDGSFYGNSFETHRYHWSDKEVQNLGFRPLYYCTNENHLVAIGAYEWRRP